MNTRILPVFKDKLIKEISYIDVMDFRSNFDVGAKRANNILVPMRSVFDLAYKEGWIQSNVMTKVKRCGSVLPVLCYSSLFYRHAGR